MNKAEKAMLALLAAQLDVLLSMQAAGKGRSAGSAEIAAARKLAEQYRAAAPAHGKKGKSGKAAKRR